MPYEVTDPYNHGTILDSSPFTHYYMQQQAHKQAKAEALDKYNQDLMKNVTPAGMRTQDVGGFTEKVNNWIKSGIANKAAINNPAIDNGKARNEFYSAHQDLLGDIAKSKNQAEIDKQFAALKNDPEKLRRLKASVIQQKQQSDLPIYHQGYKPFDMSSVEYGAAPFDVKRQDELDKAATEGFIPSEDKSLVGVSKVDPLKDVYNITKSHSPENVKVGALRYVSAYQGDPSFKEHIDDLAENLTPKKNIVGEVQISPELVQLQKGFEKYYPDKHIINPDGTMNHDNLAAAYGIQRLTTTSTIPKEEINITRQDAAKKKIKMAEMQFAHSLQNGDKKEQELNLEKYVSGLEDAAKSSGNVNLIGTDNLTADDMKSGGFPVNLSKDVASALVVQANGKAVKPDATILLPDGTWQAVVYKRTNPSTTVVKDKDNNKTTRNVPSEIVMKNGKPEVEAMQSYTREQVKANINKFFAGKIPNQVVQKKGEAIAPKPAQQGSTTIQTKSGKKLIIVE